ncbi:MAG TPA: hypothetical protein VK814_13730 [Acidobacteriaceae bacterium]|jgi:hypothetical protein|nr:hypothetical protein [Acidobacteriaceae bacterium]
MSEEQKYEAAKEYVDKQLNNMREHNAAPEVSEDEYNALVSDIAELIEV